MNSIDTKFDHDSLMIPNISDDKLIEPPSEKKRKLETNNKFLGVTLVTVQRWKQYGKLNVDCFLGFNDLSSENDRHRGSEILQNMGHFFCTLCDVRLF
jgi:hypothetical protein